MTDPAFSALQTQMFQLYQQGDYEAALQLVAQEAGRFPQQAHLLDYWRVCLAAQAGDRQQALEILQEALASGQWYPESQLREDEDLASLQGLPEFERLVEISRERHSAAQHGVRPALTILAPAAMEQAKGPPRPLLMALHGNQSSAAEHAPLWQAAGDDWLVALPQSSQLGGPGQYVWPDLDLAGDELAAHYAGIHQHYLVDPDRVVLAGFSRGGEAAIWLALTGRLPARGFLAVVPGGPLTRDPAQWLPAIEAAEGRDLRGFIVGGGQDLLIAQTRQFVAMLEEHGFRCQLRLYPELGHEYPPDFAALLPEALKYLVGMAG